MKFSLFFLFVFSFLHAAETPLFNGENLDGWKSINGQKAEWSVKDVYFEVVPGKGDIVTEASFFDFDLHAEFWIPLLPDKHGQDRGNSGFYLLGKYEVQILDSYQNETFAEGACGALYKLIAPFRNASLPPERWQTYDIRFTAPRTNEKNEVTREGVITVVHNGITVIDQGKFRRPTGSMAKERQGVAGPIRLQDHGSRVRFRNLIIQPK